MKKLMFLFVCTQAILSLNCSKEELPVTNSSQKKAATQAASNALALTLPLRPPYAGLYVNNFDQILGDQVAEDSLLAWSKRHGFNTLSLYKVRDILLASRQNELAAFCAKARSSTYELNVGFVAASANTANLESNYYQSRSLMNERQSHMLTEYEFWNSGNSFTTFSTLLTALTNAQQMSTAPRIVRQAYVSQYKDAANLSTHDTVIARKILDEVEYIVQVNYTANAYNWSTTLQNRIQTIANAAYNKNVLARVIILFNCNYNSSDPSIYNYFSTTGSNQPFVNAYLSIKNAFTANTTIVNKNKVAIVGYQVYRYTEARQARP